MKNSRFVHVDGVISVSFLIIMDCRRGRALNPKVSPPVVNFRLVGRGITTNVGVDDKPNTNATNDNATGKHPNSSGVEGISYADGDSGTTETDVVGDKSYIGEEVFTVPRQEPSPASSGGAETNLMVVEGSNVTFGSSTNELVVINTAAGDNGSTKEMVVPTIQTVQGASGSTLEANFL